MNLSGSLQNLRCSIRSLPSGSSELPALCGLQKLFIVQLLGSYSLPNTCSLLDHRESHSTHAQESIQPDSRGPLCTFWTSFWAYLPPSRFSILQFKSCTSPQMSICFFNSLKFKNFTWAPSPCPTFQRMPAGWKLNWLWSSPHLFTFSPRTQFRFVQCLKIDELFILSHFLIAYGQWASLLLVANYRIVEDFTKSI